MTLTIIGLVTVLAAVLGTAFKLYKMMRGIEVQLFNHFTSQMNRLEDKLDRVAERVSDTKK